jgi:PAS domain S-box-containing protein
LINYVSFELDQFNRLFPFYIIIDRGLIVKSYGKTIQKLFPGIEGKSFFCHFLIKRPELSKQDFDSLHSLTNQMIVIECFNLKNTILRGQVEYLPVEESFLFVGSPWFGSMEQVRENELRLDDFAFHDPMIDLLHVLKTQEITTDELKKLIQTINRQKNELKAAAKEIQDIALFPMQNPDPLIRIDFHGNVLKMNPMAELLSEFDFENKNYTPPEFWHAIAQILDKEKDREVVEVRSGDRWYSFVIKYIPQNDYFNIYGRDITNNKFKEDQLLILSSIAAQNTHGVVIADKQGNIEWVNKSFESMTGYTFEEMRGKKPGHMLQGEDTDKETIAYLKSQIYHGEPFICEILNYHKSGRPYWLRIQGQSLKDKDNQVIKYFAIEEDITAEKETKKKLLEFESRFRIALEKIGDNVWEYDFRTQKTLFSEAARHFLGYDFNQIRDINRLWWDLIYKDDLQNLMENDKKIRNSEIDYYSLEYRMHHRDGSIKWVYDRGVVTEKNTEGKPLKIMGTHTDITKQKQLELELREAKNNAETSGRFKELFLANMSHEIRTPLNAVIGFIREISREYLSPSQSLYVKNAGSASQHLLSIVNNILDMAKLESGQMQLHLRAFNLVETINNTIAILASQAEEKMLEIKSDIALGLAPSYIGDSGRITQILLNVISNAIKFTEAGGVDIRCRLTGIRNNVHDLSFTISDTGIGMEPSFLNNIFEKFTQSDLSTSRKYGGTGLGMAITYELVQLMKGEISISSVINEGTSVEINLSLEVAHEDQITPAQIDKDYSTLKNKRILLVEDNDLNRLVALNSLVHYGMRVIEATNGIEAIEKLKGEPFDLVLMDLQMPLMGGIEATSFIRKEMGTDTPIIALTASAFRAEIDRCLEAGMNDYIVKPFEERFMINVILKNLAPASSPEKIDQPAARESRKLFDLGYLEKLRRENDDFIIKMIDLFCQQVPVAVGQIKNAWREGDMDTVQKVAHRIKSNIDNFGITDLKEDIRFIEAMAAGGETSADLEARIIRLDAIIKEVVIQLEKEKEKRG